MNKKSSSRHHNAKDKCIVHRNAESSTFSKFVDKVIDEFPGQISSKVVPAFPKDPNNPYDVLRNKGFLDLSQNILRARDCSSDVKLNFYSEETRRGETVKVFMSDHHFKDGKLVYSTTHEMIPDRQRECENIARWEMRRDSRINSETISSRSVSKKLTDMLQDNKKQKTIQYYEKDATKRHACSKSLPPASFCCVRNENRKKDLHTLHSEHIHRRTQPSTSSKSQQSSPRKVECIALYKVEPANRCFEKPSTFASSSEISISSKESWSYSSPKGIVKETSRRDEKFKRTVSFSPQRKFRKDLFVIPKHTCHTIPAEIIRYRHQKVSHWDTIRRLVATPRFKYNLYHRIMESSIDHENDRYDPKISDAKPHYGKYKQISSTSSSSDDCKIRDREDFKRYLKNKDKHTSHLPSTKKAVPRNREKTSPRHSNRCLEYDDNNNKIGKAREHKEREDNSSYDKNHSGGMSQPKTTTRIKYKEHPFRTKRFKEGVRKVQVLRKPYSESERYTTATEGESESDKSSKTHPLSASSETDSDKGIMNQDEQSTDTKTSVCTLHDTIINGGLRRISSNYVKKPKYCLSQEEKEHQDEDYKNNSYEHRDAVNKKDKDLEMREEFPEKKQLKKKRHINPNKVIHFEDSGKRVSQYFDSYGAILGADRAFEKERNIHSEKRTTCRCSPKTLGYRKGGRRDKDSHKIRHREASLEKYLRRAFHEDGQTQVNLLQNTVNKSALTDYRHKYASSRNKREAEGSDSKKEFEYRRRVKKEYKTTCHHRENCEACEIEQYND